MALATILLLLTSSFLCTRRTFQPACCAQVWVMRKGGVCVCEGDAGATAGFRGVSWVVVASSTRHAAAK
eukprot:COSAG02_NODE_3173_length_7227_cov_35.536336_2_plen_69_part_00